VILLSGFIFAKVLPFYSSCTGITLLGIIWGRPQKTSAQNREKLTPPFAQIFSPIFKNPGSASILFSSSFATKTVFQPFLPTFNSSRSNR